MKNYTEYWKQTCIDFGKYVVNNITEENDDIDYLWNQFQEQQAKDINDVLDKATPNTIVSANSVALNNIEKDLSQDNVSKDIGPKHETRTGGLSPDTGPRN